MGTRMPERPRSVVQQCNCRKPLVYAGQPRSSGRGAALQRGQFRDIEHFYVFTFFPSDTSEGTMSTLMRWRSAPARVKMAANPTKLPPTSGLRRIHPVSG